MNVNRSKAQPASAPAPAPARNLRIGVTSGMRGHFAVLYEIDAAGFMEPIQTGIGSYPTPEGAQDEARSWAEAEGIKVDFDEAK